MYQWWHFESIEMIVRRFLYVDVLRWKHNTCGFDSTHYHMKSISYDAERYGIFAKQLYRYVNDVVSKLHQLSVHLRAAFA